MSHGPGARWGLGWFAWTGDASANGPAISMSVIAARSIRRERILGMVDQLLLLVEAM
jgi:hypothetical protein